MWHSQVKASTKSDLASYCCYLFQHLGHERAFFFLFSQHLVALSFVEISHSKVIYNHHIRSIILLSSSSISVLHEPNKQTAALRRHVVLVFFIFGRAKVPTRQHLPSPPSRPRSPFLRPPPTTALLALALAPAPPEAIAFSDSPPPLSSPPQIPLRFGQVLKSSRLSTVEKATNQRGNSERDQGGKKGRQVF